jgi:hypothetical protein
MNKAVTITAAAAKRPPMKSTAAMSAPSPSSASATSSQASVPTRPTTTEVVSSWLQASAPAAAPATTNRKPRACGGPNGLARRSISSPGSCAARLESECGKPTDLAQFALRLRSLVPSKRFVSDTSELPLPLCPQHVSHNEKFICITLVSCTFCEHQNRPKSMPVMPLCLWGVQTRLDWDCVAAASPILSAKATPQKASFAF